MVKGTPNFFMDSFFMNGEKIFIIFHFIHFQRFFCFVCDIKMILKHILYMCTYGNDYDYCYHYCWNKPFWFGKNCIVSWKRRASILTKCVSVWVVDSQMIVYHTTTVHKKVNKWLFKTIFHQNIKLWLGTVHKWRLIP